MTGWITDVFPIMRKEAAKLKKLEEGSGCAYSTGMMYHVSVVIVIV